MSLSYLDFFWTSSEKKKKCYLNKRKKKIFNRKKKHKLFHRRDHDKYWVSRLSLIIIIVVFLRSYVHNQRYFHQRWRKTQECTQFAEIFQYRDIAYKSRKAKLNLDASTKWYINSSLPTEIFEPSYQSHFVCIARHFSNSKKQLSLRLSRVWFLHLLPLALAYKTIILVNRRKILYLRQQVGSKRTESVLLMKVSS